MAKRDALDPHEREHTLQLPVPIPRREVDALMPEHPLHDPAPSIQMEVSPLRAPAHRVVPFSGRTLIPLDQHERHPAAVRAATVSRAAVNRNSRNRRASRSGIRPKPV